MKFPYLQILLWTLVLLITACSDSKNKELTTISGTISFCHLPSGAGMCVLDDQNIYTVIGGLDLGEDIWNNLEQAEMKQDRCIVKGTLQESINKLQIFTNKHAIEINCNWFQATIYPE